MEIEDKMDAARGMRVAFEDAKDIVENHLFPEAVSTYLNIMENAEADPSNARQVADRIFEMTGLYQKGAVGGAHLPSGGNGVQISAFLSGTNGEQVKLALEGLNTIAEGVMDGKKDPERDVGGNNGDPPANNPPQFHRTCQAPEGRAAVPEGDATEE